MASSPDPPPVLSPDSPAAAAAAAAAVAEAEAAGSYEGEVPGHPGWHRKLVPRKGKGSTPKKIDVVYVTPEGEEIKSKAQLQRYIKAHPNGPAVPELNWSTGETPRRSARLISKTPTESPAAQTTPKHGKRKTKKVYQEKEEEEEEEEEDAASTPSKRAKEKGKEFAGNEEIMQDVEKEENIVATVVELEAHGEAEKKLAEEQVSKETSSFKSVDGEKIEEESGEHGAQLEEMVVEEKPMETGSVEVIQEEPLEPLPAKSVEVPVEATGSPQLPDSMESEKKVVDSVTEGSPKKDQEKVSEEGGHHMGNSCFYGSAQDKSASQEVYHSSEPVGVTN